MSQNIAAERIAGEIYTLATSGNESVACGQNDAAKIHSLMMDVMVALSKMMASHQECAFDNILDDSRMFDQPPNKVSTDE